MNLFCIANIIYQAGAKLLTNSGIYVLDLCFIRSFTHFLISVLLVIKNKKHLTKDVPKQHRCYLFVRCIAGLLGFNSMVFALKVLNVFTTTVILNTVPFWTGILGYFILGDKVTKFEIFCMIGCFAGVVILAMSK
jgi:drug/metabolite transporter (DMT)-like permease